MSSMYVNSKEKCKLCKHCGMQYVTGKTPRCYQCHLVDAACESLELVREMKNGIATITRIRDTAQGDREKSNKEKGIDSARELCFLRQKEWKL
jgi:hypothetical protein